MEADALYSEGRFSSVMPSLISFFSPLYPQRAKTTKYSNHITSVSRFNSVECFGFRPNTYTINGFCRSLSCTFCWVQLTFLARRQADLKYLKLTQVQEKRKRPTCSWRCDRSTQALIWGSVSAQMGKEVKQIDQHLFFAACKTSSKRIQSVNGRNIYVTATLQCYKWETTTDEFWIKMQGQFSLSSQDHWA